MWFKPRAPKPPKPPPEPPHVHDWECLSAEQYSNQQGEQKTVANLRCRGCGMLYPVTFKGWWDKAVLSGSAALPPLWGGY